MKSRQSATQYHGQNKAEAVARAGNIRGHAIRSWAPDTSPRHGDWGYYSAPQHPGMIRTGEEVIFQYEAPKGTPLSELPDIYPFD